MSEPTFKVGNRVKVKGIDIVMTIRAIDADGTCHVAYFKPVNAVMFQVCHASYSASILELYN